MLTALTTSPQGPMPSDEPDATAMRLYTETGTSLNSQLYSTAADTSTTSHANLELASQWLMDCLTNHKLCRQYQRSSRPKRLIEITNPETPFLVDSSSIKDCQYATLSYKWEDQSANPYTTMKDNINSHYNSIPFKALPSTIRQTMLVTKQLGLRYLWIDRLCLIQDSAADKDSEIPRMGDIYRGSTLTLYAWAADDAQQGLSVDRDPRWVKPCRLPLRVTFGSDVKPCRRPLPETSENNEMSGFIWARTTVPPSRTSVMKSRGWILQEQRLAVRKLLFGHRELCWDCQSESWSENFPGLQREYGEQPGKDKDTIQYWLHASNKKYDRQTSFKQANLYDSWYKVIGDYTNRNLGNNADVLPGLAGLAKTLADNHGIQYINGLWMEDMEAGLLWRVVRDETGVQRVAGWFGKPGTNSNQQMSLEAPSWTWVSQWGKAVEFSSHYRDYHQFELTCKIKNSDGPKEHHLIATNDRENHDSFQKVTGQTLRLKGPLMQAMVCERSGGYEDFPVISPQGSRWIQDVAEPGSGKLIGYIELDESPQKRPVMGITCILCCMTQPKSGDWMYTYLALETTNRRLHEYRRVGIVQATAEDVFFEPGYEFEALDPVSRDKCWRKTTIWLV